MTFEKIFGGTEL